MLVADVVEVHVDAVGRRDFVAEITPAVRDGRIQFRETVVDGGLDAAPQAFIDLLHGANTGKMVVKL